MKEKFVLLEFNKNYAVSNLGNIINVKTEQKLNGWLNKDGYVMVELKSKSKKRTCFLLHRLIGMMFIENPQNKPQINHKNGIKNDNKIENLEWVTHHENQKHAWETGLKKHNKPIKSIEIETGEEIVFNSIRECANYYDCNAHYIQRVLKGYDGRTSYKGKKFEYIRI
jgi:hypothetical protein